MGDEVPAPESPTVTRESLLNDSSRDEFADSLPDTSQYFEAWLESLEPSAKIVDNPATPSQLNFQGALRALICYVLGVVHSPAGMLTVSKPGSLHGNVLVATAIIEGLIRGDIRATERIELGGTGARDWKHRNAGPRTNRAPCSGGPSTLFRHPS